MNWNWEQDSWPNFTFDASRLQGYEYDFIDKSGMVMMWAEFTARRFKFTAEAKM